MSNIKDFIEYTRDVLDNVSSPKPTWFKCVINFQRMVNEKPESFGKVFQKFIDLNRKNLEAPLFVKTMANHEWLKIPADEDWSTKGYRGVVISINPDSEKLQNYSLPISEIYSLCLKYYASNTNVKSLHYELVPITFLHKLFKCLVDVEPENDKLQSNLKSAESVISDFYADEVAESKLTNSQQQPMRDIFENIKGMMSDPSAMEGISALMASMGLPQEMISLASTVPGIIQDVKTRVESGESIQAALSSVPIVGDLMKDDSLKGLFETGKAVIEKQQQKVPVACEPVLEIENPAEQE